MIVAFTRGVQAGRFCNTHIKDFNDRWLSVSHTVSKPEHKFSEAD